MKNISEYDKRQLKLMYEQLVFFEKKRISLCSLIGCLEFLLNALELVDEKWEKNFLKETAALETVNAIEILRESEEGNCEMSYNEKEGAVMDSVNKLKKLIKENFAE